MPRCEWRSRHARAHRRGHRAKASRPSGRERCPWQSGSKQRSWVWLERWRHAAAARWMRGTRGHRNVPVASGPRIGRANATSENARLAPRSQAGARDRVIERNGFQTNGMWRSLRITSHPDFGPQWREPSTLTRGLVAHRDRRLTRCETDKFPVIPRRLPRGAVFDTGVKAAVYTPNAGRPAHVARGPPTDQSRV